MSLESWSNIEIHPFKTDTGEVDLTIRIRKGASENGVEENLLARMSKLLEVAKSPSTKNKIVSVKKRVLPGPVKVYDIENLEGHRNFSLGNSVIVHNSASGGLRFARFEYFQEFLPLKGKPPNVMKDKKSADIVNEEILNIFAMLGLDPKNEDPMTKLRVGKIILMPDSDADGSHIAALLSGLLHKYIPQVFEMGMMYVTRVPEYYAIHNRVIYYGNTLDAVRSDLSRDKVKADVNHLKGYGECPSDLLRIFACDPKTRLLTKLGPAADERFELLMSSDTSSRKILLGI